MQNIFNLIFDNILIVGFFLAVYLIYKQYNDLKNRTSSILDLFNKTLLKYLEDKFNQARLLAEELKKEYGHVDKLNTEIERLLYIIDKSNEKTINNYVETSNALNKFKIDKKIDAEKYPRMLELNKIKLFTDEEMESLDNGLAIARKEYNTEAFRYNEKASSFPIQYLTKYLKLNTQYSIFDALTKKYSDIYEVFEEEEPEINFLSSLNYVKEDEVPDELPKLKDSKEDEVIEISSYDQKNKINKEDQI